jgi:DNA-directed RNA polymerase subunit H (RpoH/RPB5)
MRPLPHDKKHGVIHTIQVRQDQVDKIAEALNISPKDKARMRPGDVVHIVREAKDTEFQKP